MPTRTTRDEELLPIDEVARRLGIRASAIRYYEERGLVLPSSRQSGRRWYGPSEIRRLAIILYWQEYALMSLDEIGEILAGSGATRGWAEIVQSRIGVLGEQIERMEAGACLPCARCVTSRCFTRWVPALRGQSLGTPKAALKSAVLARGGLRPGRRYCGGFTGCRAVSEANPSTNACTSFFGLAAVPEQSTVPTV